MFIGFLTTSIGRQNVPFLHLLVNSAPASWNMGREEREREKLSSRPSSQPDLEIEIGLNYRRGKKEWRENQVVESGVLFEEGERERERCEMAANLGGNLP